MFFLKTFSTIQKGQKLTEFEFMNIWGSENISFYQELKFFEVFKIGFSVYTDDLKMIQILGSWSKINIPLLMTKKQYFRRKFSIFDPINIAMKEDYLKNFRCKFCFSKATTKQNLLAHEKICQNGTIYKFIQKEYGSDLKTAKKSLQDEKIIDSSASYFQNFCSFDIECLNTKEPPLN